MEDQQEKKEQYDNAAQQYLEKLKKKISHQVKNPFNLPLSTFQFEELHGWKNAVVQLDTSTKIYGLRVDYLHEDVLKILNNVTRNNLNFSDNITQVLVRNEQNDDKKNNNNNNNQKQIEFHKHLEDIQNIKNFNFQQENYNSLLWATILKRCDTLNQLMLFTLHIQEDLSISLDPNDKNLSNKVILRTQLDPKEFQNNKIRIDHLQIFKQIQKVSQQVINSFTLSNDKQVNLSSNKKKNELEHQLPSINYENQEQQYVRNNLDFQNQQYQDFINKSKIIQPFDEFQLVEIKKEDVIVRQKVYEDQQNYLIPSFLKSYISNPYQIQNEMNKKNINLLKNRRNIPKNLKKINVQKYIDFNLKNEDANKIFYPNKKQKFQNKLLPIDLSIGFPFSQAFLIRNSLLNTKKRTKPKYFLTQLIKEDPNFSNFSQFIDETNTMIHVSQLNHNASMKNIKKELGLLINQNQQITLAGLVSNCPEYEPIDIFTALLHVAHQKQLNLSKKQSDVTITRQISKQ